MLHGSNTVLTLHIWASPQDFETREFEGRNNDHVIEGFEDSDNQSVASGRSDDSEMEPFEDCPPKIE